MKTVCLVGMAPSSRDLIEREPAGEETWGLNQAHVLYYPDVQARFTRWFQLHPWSEMVARQKPELAHLEWLRTCKIPVYTEEVQPDISTSVRYPYEDVCTDIGGTYLTSAMAYMLALAIYEKFELIKVFGIDMATGTEYEDQRPCFEHLLGLALGRGIAVWLPPDCPLLKGPLYAKTVMVPTTKLEAHLRSLEAQRQKVMAEYNRLVGALDLLQTLLAEAVKGTAEQSDSVLARDSNGYVIVRQYQDRHIRSPMPGIQDLGIGASSDVPIIGNLPPVESRINPLVDSVETRVHALVDSANRRSMLAGTLF